MATGAPFVRQVGEVSNVVEYDGRGSLVSNVSAHDANPSNFVSFVDLITDVAGRIRKRPGTGPVKGATIGGVTFSNMHEFTRIDRTTKVVTRWLFKAAMARLWYWDGAAWIEVTPLPFTWVASRAYVKGSIVIPTAASNRYFECTTAGVAAGVEPAWNTTVGLTTNDGTAVWTCRDASSMTWVFENADNRCFAVNGYSEMIVFDGTSWKIAGCDGPISPMGYSLGGTFTATTGGAHTITAHQGSPTVTKTAGSAWDGSGPTFFMNGKTIEINGARYTISTIDGANTLTLTENFREADYVAGASYKIFYGVGDWNNAPKAAYGYYNPTTGHASNIRAAALTTRNITEVAEKDRTAQTITWTNIVYDPIAYANGFTKIVLYRTPAESTILQSVSRAIVDINNSNVAGSTSYTETVASFRDTALDKFPAPETKLTKPPIGMTTIKFFNGRLWGTKDDKVYYSLMDADVLGEYGVATESWPSTQYITVDQPRGLKTIGGDSGEDNLVVLTAQGAYGIAGYDRRTIYAYPLGAREGGTYQLAAIGSAHNLIAFYGDKHLVGLDGTDFGTPIQNKLDTIKDALLAGVRLIRFAWQSRDFLLLSVPKDNASAANDYTYIFDVSLNKWYEWSVGFTAFAVAHDSATGALQLWASRPGGKSFQLLVDNTWQDEGNDFSPTFVTSQARVFGEDVRTEIKSINAFVNDSSQPWGGELLINEQAVGGGQAFSFKQTRGADQSAQGREMDWGIPLSVRASSNVLQLKITCPPVNADVIIEKLAYMAVPRQSTDRKKP